MNARADAAVTVPPALREGLEQFRQRPAQDKPGSPCIAVCTMNATSGLCDGCLRTLDKIAAWSALDDAARRAVWGLIEQRANRTRP